MWSFWMLNPVVNTDKHPCGLLQCRESRGRSLIQTDFSAKIFYSEFRSPTKSRTANSLVARRRDEWFGFRFPTGSRHLVSSKSSPPAVKTAHSSISWVQEVIFAWEKPPRSEIYRSSSLRAYVKNEWSLNPFIFMKFNSLCLCVLIILYTYYRRTRQSHIAFNNSICFGPIYGLSSGTGSLTKKKVRTYAKVNSTPPCAFMWGYAVAQFV